MIFEKRKFLVVMALLTVLMISVSIFAGEIDMAEGIIEEAEVLKINDTTSLESESFDIIANEIESKKAEMKTEVTEEVTTEVKEEITTVPATEEVTTEQVIEQPKKKVEYTAKSIQSKSTNYVAKATEQVTTTKPTEEVTEEIEIVEDTTEVPDIGEPNVDEGLVEEPTEQPTEAPKKKSMYYPMTEDEIYTFAALIYLEAGSTSYKCQCAVASVVINLMVNEGKSLNACIKTPGRFSVANRVYRTKPSDTALKVARKIATNGPTLPTYVLYFRNNHYFSWAKAYCHIDNVYFSY
jgi:spore germination cell wall hydrolase CwlJ-like protein